MRRALLSAVLICGAFYGLEGTPVAQGCNCPFPFPSICLGFAGADPPTICPGQSVRLVTGAAIGPCLWSPSEGVTDPLACMTTATALSHDSILRDLHGSLWWLCCHARGDRGCLATIAHSDYYRAGVRYSGAGRP